MKKQHMFCVKFFVVVFLLCISLPSLHSESDASSSAEKFSQQKEAQIFETADDHDCSIVAGPRCTCAAYPDRIACEWFGIHPQKPCYWIGDCAQYWDPPIIEKGKQKGETQ